jgi:hypothetical protein
MSRWFPPPFVSFECSTILIEKGLRKTTKVFQEGSSDGQLSGGRYSQYSSASAMYFDFFSKVLA